jgi:hypothetical protein
MASFYFDGYLLPGNNQSIKQLRQKAGLGRWFGLLLPVD